MTTRTVVLLLVALFSLASLVLADDQAGQGRSSSTDGGNARQARPPESLARSLVPDRPSELRRLAEEVLERNPRIALMERRAAALSYRPDQAGSLPDPMANVNLFALPPETRVGPQRLMIAVSQKFPWFGKLGLKRQAALLASQAAEADVESARLEALTEVRRLFHELAFQQELVRIVSEERQILRRHEEAARARYSAGMGLQQEVVRIQAQLTRLETRLLDIEARRATLLAAINALRDRPSDIPISAQLAPLPEEVDLDLDELRVEAFARRPELVAADATIASRQATVDLAKKQFRPDVTVGLGYTLVDRRSDPAGRVSPPPDNGDDILSLSGGLNLPIRRRRLNAGLEESLQMRSVAEESKRQIRAGIERSIGDLASRLPLLYEQWTLFEDVLLVQAEEALRSAETAYATGRLNAVDLLDAEVVLFEVQKSIARTRTDLTVGLAQLEGATATRLRPRAP